MAPHDGQHGPLRGGGHLQLRHAAGRGARGQVSTFCIRSHVDISTSGDTWPDQHSVTCHVARSALCHMSRGYVSTVSREHVSPSHVLWLAVMLCDGDEASHCADGGSSTLYGPLSFILTS